MQSLSSTNNKNSVSAPYRGDIIVDACILFELCPEIPKNDTDTNKYLTPIHIKLTI